MRARDGRVAFAGALAVAALGCSTAAAQDAPIGWDAPCGEPAAFVAAVVGLGGSFEGVGVEVEVAAIAGGSFRGRLTIRRGEQAPELRELDDIRCEDVVDALAIAGALALRRTAPPPEPDAVTVPTARIEPAVTVVPERPPPLGAEPGLPPPPRDEPARVGLGASLRGGVGPTPGL